MLYQQLDHFVVQKDPVRRWFVENQIEVSSRRDNELELTDNAVLARLVRELRDEIIPVPAAYNRTHNRHNR